jgi:hypothetical protein
MNTPKLIAMVAPYIALLCAVGMVTIGAYAAAIGRTVCATFGIGGSMITACMATPMLFESNLVDMLGDSALLLICGLGLDLGYLAVTEAAAVFRVSRFRHSESCGSIDWDVFIPAPNEPLVHA